MNSWSEMTVKDLQTLVQVIREAGRPVHVNVLAQAAVRSRLEAEAQKRLYAPGARYTHGETIHFNGQPAKVKAVTDGSNPKQGSFKILTLVLPDGTERHMAAEVPGAPAEDRLPVTEEQVHQVMAEHGAAVRRVVQEALRADERFVWFQDALGDHWCLQEMLPEVGDEELARVRLLLQGRLKDGVLGPCPTEALVKEVWGQENDGSADYLVKAFALNAALQECEDVRWMGTGWVLEAEWQQLQERPTLVPPRQQNVVIPPDNVAAVEEGEEIAEEEEQEEQRTEEEQPVEEDLETWRQNRLSNATITLKAQHYYGNWLPLTQAMRRLFPPRASGADAVTFYHRFGGKEESFPAWVDWESGRILGSPAMYQAFYEHGIYPGAKLVISHRGNEREYEIRTKPVEGEQRVLVRRVFLTEEGTLEYEEVEEPVRYEIARDVFVADARWEDLDALFRQAEEAGAGIFQLMYEKCLEWWEENGRQPLIVTAQQLWKAIHFDDRGRLTSKATIAWELWRRLAFEPVGDGKYRFRPEKRDRVRSLGTGERQRRRRAVPRGSRIQRDESLQETVTRKERLQPEETQSASPSESPVERTRTGQLITADPALQEPLFEQEQSPTAATPSEAVAEIQEPREAAPPEEPTVPETVPPPAAEPPSAEGGGGPPSAPQQPPTPSRPRSERPRSSSKSLFSQHYLEHRIQEHPEWAEDVVEPFEHLRALYEAKRDILPSLNEAQTESEFIRPVLDILGFAYIPQTPTRRAGRIQRPDYALFADEGAKAEAYPLQDDEPAFYARVLAIADAKYWERPLSEVSRDDPRDDYRNTNPSFQMVNYLTGTGVDWGILTNGRIWRLYYRQASSTATEFYEVDLVDLLESGDLERFKYFWLFFRREAFIKDAQGRNFLERVREGSATYARVIGERLKELVFEEVFPFLSGGFVAYGAARGEDVTSEEARRLIYEATLSLLYKLLFLLYAEARNLLPMDNPGYRAQSLTRMAQRVARRIDRREPLGETSTALYDGLLNLFRLVDRGDRGLGLPRYNGGLFHFDFSDAADRERHRANWFLDQHKVPDVFLAPALNLLYRADGEPIDYSFLGVRHLGAIYEGLLEHRLVVDDAARGQVHLETDKGERKATGSYYTPDYIVKYIVRHTVGPILEERAQRFDDLMAKIAEVRRKLADGRRTASIPVLREELERLEHQAREALLDIKICDPAMGSGHFLVEAVDFLTDGLIEILNRYSEHNPVLNMLDRIRQDIVAGLARQGISIDPSRLDDTQLLQRVVMKRCIYGVDLNPMAVELAKVSLWLHSFTIGAPLSFLDHHLRCGNSLIGAMAREAHEQLSSELPLLTGPFAGLLQAAQIMRGISLLSDATFAEVEKSEQLFRQFDKAAKPYKQLLDIYVARHFGVKRADEFLRLYGPDAIQAGPDTVGEPYATVIREAHRLYEEKRFFHWDLEFPEVFIDLERATWKENPGFDAVVGNPPYGFIDDRNLQKALTAQYVAIASYDNYAAFIERGIQILKTGGALGYIAPTSWQTGPLYRDLREYVLKSCQVALIVNLPYDVFADAYIDTSIYVLKKEHPYHPEASLLDRPVRAYEFGKREQAADKLLSEPRCWQIASREWLGDEQLRFIVNRRILQLRKVLAKAPLVPLGAITESARGVLADETDLSTRRISSAFKPYFTGDLFRYELSWNPSVWVRYGANLREMPSSYKYFCGPRVLVRRLISRQARLMATYTEEEFVNKKDIYNVVVVAQAYDGLTLLAFVNSRLLSLWYISQSMVATRDDFPQVTLTDLRALPIRRIAFTTPPDERKRLVDAGITEATEWIERIEGDSVSFSAFSDSAFGRWLDERLSPIHTPDPELVRQHNADPLNKDWQLPEEGPVEQSDVVHDLLAHLAEQMVEMNKEKQAEIKGFLNWLEREIGASIDDLSNKTKLRNYLGDYQKGEPHLTLEELLAILRRNRRKLRVDPSARAFQERLEREYQASLDKLLPLKRRLAATDRLIDLIVYRLYGLTEEEVAIVEGGSP